MILQALVLCAAAAVADPIAIYDEAVAARKDRDATRLLQLTGQLIEYALASPLLRFLHAEALALSGQTQPALVELRWLADHGYDYAFWERDSFASLRVSETASLRAAMTKNGAPAGRIARVVNLDRTDLDPEGIAALGQDWIVGSMANGSLYRVNRAGATTVLWHETEAGRRVFGVRHDPQRNLLWACSNGPDDRRARPQLLRVALEPLAVTRLPVPDARALCNDIALLPEGAVAISDSQRGAVWQLANDGSWRGLWTMDLAASRLTPVTEQGTFIGGIDGLYAVDGDLVTIQNGLRPHRVLRIVLSPNAGRVLSVAAIASGVPELAAMTTAAVARREIVVLAGSQLVVVSSGSAGD